MRSFRQFLLDSSHLSRSISFSSKSFISFPSCVLSHSFCFPLIVLLIVLLRALRVMYPVQLLRSAASSACFLFRHRGWWRPSSIWSICWCWCWSLAWRMLVLACCAYRLWETSGRFRSGLVRFFSSRLILLIWYCFAHTSLWYVEICFLGHLVVLENWLWEVLLTFCWISNSNKMLKELLIINFLIRLKAQRNIFQSSICFK